MCVCVLRCLGARDSNQDPLANRIVQIESRDLKKKTQINNFNISKMVKTSQRIERNLGLRFESCDFKSLQIGAIRSAAHCAPRIGTSKCVCVCVCVLFGLAHVAHDKHFNPAFGLVRRVPSQSRSQTQKTADFPKDAIFFSIHGFDG